MSGYGPPRRRKTVPAIPTPSGGRSSRPVPIWPVTSTAGRPQPAPSGWSAATSTRSVPGSQHEGVRHGRTRSAGSSVQERRRFGRQLRQGRETGSAPARSRTPPAPPPTRVRDTPTVARQTRATPCGRPDRVRSGHGGREPDPGLRGGEKQAGQKLTEHSDELLDKVREPFEEIKQDVTDSARESVQQVKETARDAGADHGAVHQGDRAEHADSGQAGLTPPNSAGRRLRAPSVAAVRTRSTGAVRRRRTGSEGVVRVDGGCVPPRLSVARATVVGPRLLGPPRSSSVARPAPGSTW